MTLKILHISLAQQGNDYASLRYFWDNPNNYKEHRLPLAEIEGLNDRAEIDCYTRLPVGYEKTGQALYNWLDESDRAIDNSNNGNLFYQFLVSLLIHGLQDVVLINS